MKMDSKAIIFGINQETGNNLFEFQLFTLPMSIYMTDSLKRLIIVLHYNNIYVYNTNGEVVYRHIKNESFITFNILPNETSLLYYYHNSICTTSTNLICVDLITFEILWKKSILIDKYNDISFIKSANI